MSSLPSPQHYWDHELLSLPETPADWLFGAFVARRNVSLLTSLWKAGKTTLLALVLAKRKTGGTLAGVPVAAGKTIVLSEEPPAFWTERARRYDFGGNLCLLPQPFNHVPNQTEWLDLLGHVGRLRDETGADLFVVDTLSHFLRGENHGVQILDALMPLGELTRRGMAVWLMHHPRKRAPEQGQSARGHGALLGHIDISIEMRHGSADPDSRARRLYCQSRHAATPRHFLMELTPAGDDYVRLPDADDEGFHQHWDVLRMVLEDAPQELTRYDILDEWPADFDKPNASTLWRWLKRATAANLVLSAGTGRKTDPFRYRLPESEERWRAESPFYDVFKKQEADLKLPFQSLRERKRIRSDDAKLLRDLDRPLKKGEKLWPPGSPVE
jgi:hypothetical protein